MSEFYDDLRDMASEVLEEFQQGVVTLKRYNAPAMPPNEYTEGTPSAPTYFPLNAVATRQHQRYQNGVLIIETGDMITFAVFGYTPLLTDKFIIDGRERSLSDIKPIPSAGDPVAWQAWCAA